jgi:hypothetical protein
LIASAQSANTAASIGVSQRGRTTAKPAGAVSGEKWMPPAVSCSRMSRVVVPVVAVSLKPQLPLKSYAQRRSAHAIAKPRALATYSTYSNVSTLSTLNGGYRVQWLGA